MSVEADQIIKIYRRHAHTWASRRGTELSEQKWLDRFIELLPDTSLVLDLGCGSGEPIGRYLLENDSILTGVDASPELIEIAQDRVPNANWIVSDMRTLQLDAKFHGIIAWNSFFHLTPNDQRKMFPIFEQHAAAGAALMFTSGPDHGEVIGEFEGEPLYHSSLSPDEYAALLDRHGFDLIDHFLEDPDCNLQTVWLAQFRRSK